MQTNNTAASALSEAQHTLESSDSVVYKDLQDEVETAPSYQNKLETSISKLTGVQNAYVEILESKYSVKLVLTDSTQQLDDELSDAIKRLIASSTDSISEDQITITVISGS